MRSNNDLEWTIKEKVSPLLEQTIEKSFGIIIPKLETDITDTLKNVSVSLYIPFNTTYPEAKRLFKREFLKQQLRIHKGNVSQLAKFLGIDRRSIHRSIKEFRLSVERIEKKQLESQEREFEWQIDQAIRHALENYRDIIQPKKMELMYDELPLLSRNIAKSLPLPAFTWKEAEEEFERQFLENALKKWIGNISETARKIALRKETLYRKIKKLGLRYSRPTS